MAETKKNNDDIGELHPREKALIKLIRERFRFGEIVIDTRDGLPHQVRRYVDIARL